MHFSSSSGRLKTILFVLLVCLGLGGLTSAVRAEEPASGDTEAVDPKAMQILKSMAGILARAEQFSVTVRSSYDAPQADGQMIEFGAVRKIQVKRPEKIRVDMTRSDGNQRTLLIDGKRIVVHHVASNVYSQATYQGSLDATIRHLVGDLKVPLPLARMFLTTLPADLERMVEALDYVEQDLLTPVPSHPLAARSRDVDFQVWIGTGDQPLLQRIVITYKRAEGQPQFRADFSDWDFAPDTAQGPFEFVPPADTQEVPLLIPGLDNARASLQPGGDQ